MAETSPKGESAPSEFIRGRLSSTPMPRELHFSSTFPKVAEQELRNFCVSKICRRNKDKIISLDYSNDGEHVIGCCADNILLTYNCLEGVTMGSLNLKKYGGDIVRWGPELGTVIHSSKNLDFHLRYLAFHRAKYIRYLKGHQKKVLSLSLSKTQLISGSLDQSIRLWDLRSPECIDVKYFTGETISSFHPAGILVATGISSQMVVYHDFRFAARPLNSFTIQGEGNWGDLKFSNNGKFLLISTNNSRSYLTDPERGSVIHVFEGYSNANAFQLEASFTPDSQFVMIGSEDGKVHIWNAESGRKVLVLNHEQVDSITCLQFSPKLMSFVSANTNMAFWEPRISDHPSDKSEVGTK